jgi:RNA polymerase sigma-32 factor
MSGTMAARAGVGRTNVSPNHRDWERYRSQALQQPLLDAERERHLLERAKQGGREAAAELVASHMRLVVHVASTYARDGLNVHDLVGEGVVGLMEAVQRFDLDRDVRFASYATWWVRSRVRAHALANRRIVGMPDTRNARVVRSRMRASERRLTQQLGRRPSRLELAQELGVSEQDVELVDAALSARDVPVLPASFEPCDDTEGPEQTVARAESEAQRSLLLTRALATLSVRERDVVCAQLGTEESPSLSQLGRSLGISRQRAGQILAGAREKLRAELRCAV